jgi:hypothetical protein
MNFLRTYIEAVIGTIVIATFLLVFGIVVATLKHWPGDDEYCVKLQDVARRVKNAHGKPVKITSQDQNLDCSKDDPVTAKNAVSRAADECYCESAGKGMIKQPVSTWSALAFCLVGLAILAHVGWLRDHPAPPRRENTMTMGTHYPTVYGFALLLMGPGSMAFHATMKYWGGRIDLISLFFFTCFVLAYNFTKGLQKATGYSGTVREVLFWVFYVVLLTLFSVLVCVFNCVGTTIFILSGVGTGIVELIFCLWIIERNTFYFWASGRLFALAFIFWMFSKGKVIPCNPDSVFQWHALWHVVAALFIGWVYLHLRTERTGAAPV